MVLLDRQADSTDDLHLTAVGSDLVHESEVAGLWLADTAGDEECRIDELQGTTGSSSATDRATGFRNAIEATTISRSSAPGPATSPGPAAGM